jgi:hypothetical protein
MRHGPHRLSAMEWTTSCYLSTSPSIYLQGSARAMPGSLFASVYRGLLETEIIYPKCSSVLENAIGHAAVLRMDGSEFGQSMDNLVQIHG